jgi:hypothetical protein
MSNGLNQQAGDVVAQVNTDGANPPVIASSAGVNSQTDTPAGVVRNGAGDYTVNFPGSPCDVRARSNKVTSLVAGQIASIASGSDTFCNVLVTDATGGAIDGGFDLCIRRTKEIL